MFCTYWGRGGKGRGGEGRVNRAVATRFEVVRLDNSGVSNKAREARTLGGSGGMLPQENVLGLLRSFLVQFWGKIATT